jgi:hypothetical protein
MIFSYLNITQLVMNKNMYSDLVKSMRNPDHYKERCQSETNILHKCILCRKFLPPIQWSPIMEAFIKQTFDLSQPVDHTSGDGLSRNKKSIEIKVSFGDAKGQFNFVQIRPDHNIDYYIFLCYDLYYGQLGKLYWFFCDSEELYSLLPEYGGYSHGTISKFGKITKENIFGLNREFSLRPNPKNNGKSKKLWTEFKKRFLSNEKRINENLH